MRDFIQETVKPSHLKKFIQNIQNTIHTKYK